MCLGVPAVGFGREGWGRRSGRGGVCSSLGRCVTFLVFLGAFWPMGEDDLGLAVQLEVGL